MGWDAPVHQKLPTVTHKPWGNSCLSTTSTIPPPFMSGQCTIAEIEMWWSAQIMKIPTQRISGHIHTGVQPEQDPLQLLQHPQSSGKGQG